MAANVSVAAMGELLEAPWGRLWLVAQSFEGVILATKVRFNCGFLLVFWFYCPLVASY